MASAPKQPKPPPFYPIDIAATAAGGVTADEQGWSLADADFTRRFGGLVRARDQTLQSSYDELTGPLDPELQGEMVRRGAMSSISAFGEGGFEAGSVGSNTLGATVARGTLAKQDSDREYASFLRQLNPQRAFGFSGGDIANLSIFNTGNANQSTQNAYATQVAGINGQAAANQQNMQLILGLANSAAGAYAGRR